MRPETADRWLRIGWLALPAALLAVTFASVLGSPLSINHDAALYLDCAALLLAGAVPYVDFVDLNPPLIMYLSALPVGLARLISAPPIPTFSALVLALAAWSTFALYARVRAMWPSLGEAAAGSLAVCWASYAFALWRVGEFGQRDQLFLLVFVPFLLLRWMRWSGAPVGPREALALGAAIGIAACLKPQLTALVLAAELYFAASARRLRPCLAPELAAALAVALLYAGHFLLVPEAMRESLFGRWLPLVAAGYSAYDFPLARLISVPVGLALLLAPAVFAIRSAWSGRVADLAGALATCSAAGAAVYLAQHKGFSYHEIPMRGCLGLLLVTLGLAGLERLGRRAGRRRLGAALLALAALWSLFLVIVSRPLFPVPPSVPTPPPLLQAIRQYTASGEPVLIVSTSVTPAYPALLQLRRRPGSRYLWFFPIPMLLSRTAGGGPGGSRSADAAQLEERRFLAELEEDITSRRPPLVLVQRRGVSQGLPRGLSPWDYLRHTGLLDRALGGYQPLGAIDEFEGYVRKERAATR